MELAGHGVEVDRDPYPDYIWSRLAIATMPFLGAATITGTVWGFGGAVNSSYVVGASPSQE